MTVKTGTTGYYRYTDIAFEWYKKVPEYAQSPLKAFLSAKGLVSPEHPLSNGPGEGIALIMGTLRATNESRLLFSSAHIEYTRYWLHAMGFTTELIPLPNSRYLITDDQLFVQSPAIYKSADEIKQAVKQMTKNNKRVKGVDAELADMRVTFEKIRSQFAKKNAVWCSIDFEGWEGASDVITEFGYSVLRWENGVEVSESGHWVIAERNNKRNGQYVPDNRDYYLFGDTQSMNRFVFKERIAELVASLSKLGPLMLVFHDFGGDIKYLQKLEAPIDSIQYALPETAEQNGIYCIDTRKMFSALEGDKNPKSLVRVCRLLKFHDAERFHNAGNDAEYTLMALKSMASGKPLDEQREERWPTRATMENVPGSLKGVKRQEIPEDDSDWEAMEDVL